MLHVGWNMDDCAWEDFLRRLAFLLIPATSGYTYQHLSATLCGVVRMPVVTAARLKGNVEERYLTIRYLCQITVAFEVFGVSCVGFANRESVLFSSLYHFFKIFSIFSNSSPENIFDVKNNSYSIYASLYLSSFAVLAWSLSRLCLEKADEVLRIFKAEALADLRNG